MGEFFSLLFPRMCASLSSPLPKCTFTPTSPPSKAPETHTIPLTYGIHTPPPTHTHTPYHVPPYYPRMQVFCYFSGNILWAAGRLSSGIPSQVVGVLGGQSGGTLARRHCPCWLKVAHWKCGGRRVLGPCLQPVQLFTQSVDLQVPLTFSSEEVDSTQHFFKCGRGGGLH